MRIPRVKTIVVLLAISTVFLFGCGKPGEAASVQAAQEPLIASASAQVSAVSKAVVAPTATPASDQPSVLDSAALSPLSPLAEPTAAQSQFAAYEHGPGPVGTLTPMPVWAGYTDPTGRVSFEYPEDWTLAIRDTTEEVISINLAPPSGAADEINGVDRMSIQISALPHSERKHRAPWFVIEEMPGRLEYYDMSVRVSMLTPIYVPDAMGFIYLMKDWYAGDFEHADADLTAVFYNVEDEIFVSIRGARTDYALQERAFKNDLRTALQQDHQIFLHLVDSLMIGADE